MMTSAVQTSIQATSPLLGVGAGAAAAFFSSTFTVSVTVPALASTLIVSVTVVVVVAAGLFGVDVSTPACASAVPAAPNVTAPRNAASAISFFIGCAPLERFRAGLAGADAHDLFELEHEDLAVADLAGVGRLLDRLDHLLEHLALDRGFDLDLRQKVDDVLGAAVELGMALLPPEALHLGHRDALHADGGQRLTHLVELERLDDGRD